MPQRVESNEPNHALWHDTFPWEKHSQINMYNGCCVRGNQNKAGLATRRTKTGETIKARKSRYKLHMAKQLISLANMYVTKIGYAKEKASESGFQLHMAM